MAGPRQYPPGNTPYATLHAKVASLGSIHHTARNSTVLLSTLQGGIKVPPCPADGWSLTAGTNDDAAAADLIVLATVYEVAGSILEQIAPEIRGKGKTILDMTNPS